MKNSWKLGMFTALCASIAFLGCGDDDDDAMNTGGGGSSAGKGGTSAGNGGKTTNGGTSAGNTMGGTTAGKGGSGGNGGSSMAGKGGGGGTAPVGGAADGGTAPLGGASEGGAAGSGECVEDAVGGAGSDVAGAAGAGGAASVGTAVILIDNVVVKNGATVVHQWQFADATQISNSFTPTNPGDKWSRYFYGDPSSKSGAGASNLLAKCDGNPAPGSLKNVVPFTDANQYYEVDVPFAPEDYTGLSVTAKVKLVSGGKPDAACPARATLYVIGANTGGPKNGAGVALPEGQWVDASLTLADEAGVDTIDRLGVNLNTYGCQ
jgi:hypothetical protein